MSPTSSQSFFFPTPVEFPAFPECMCYTSGFIDLGKAKKKKKLKGCPNFRRLVNRSGNDRVSPDDNLKQSAPKKKLCNSHQLLQFCKDEHQLDEIFGRSHQNTFKKTF